MGLLLSRPFAGRLKYFHQISFFELETFKVGFVALGGLISSAVGTGTAIGSGHNSSLPMGPTVARTGPASLAAAVEMTIGGGARFRAITARNLVFGRPSWGSTMMQPCASTAKLQAGGPNLHSGIKTAGFCGAPPPRVVLKPR